MRGTNEAMPATSVSEAKVSVDGLRLFVHERGVGHPLLLINGLGADAAMWGEVERVLACRSRTIVFDAPGTGRSHTPLLPLPIPALARIVGRLLDRLGHDEVDVLGYSFGGAVAQQLARAEPQRIRRLALVSTWCGWGGDPGSPAAVARALRELTAQGNPLGCAYQLWSLAGWSSLPWLDRIETPTLVVSGGADELVPPRNAVRLARRLPNSRLQLLPAGGHLLMFDTESAGASLLADFFSSDSLDGSIAWTTGLLAAERAAAA
jgi:pimeloyl-ACP methyl ester carboxylesterase